MSDEPRGRHFWTATAIGWLVIAYGIVGLLRANIDIVGFGAWFLGAAVVHDLLVAPVVFGVGWLLTRALPPPWRTPVKAATAVSAVLVVFVWPLVRGYGRSAALPSALPLDYVSNLIGALAVIWSLAVAWCAVRTVLATRRRV